MLHEITLGRVHLQIVEFERSLRGGLREKALQARLRDKVVQEVLQETQPDCSRSITLRGPGIFDDVSTDKYLMNDSRPELGDIEVRIRQHYDSDADEDEDEDDKCADYGRKEDLGDANLIEVTLEQMDLLWQEVSSIRKRSLCSFTFQLARNDYGSLSIIDWDFTISGELDAPTMV